MAINMMSGMGGGIGSSAMAPQYNQPTFGAPQQGMPNPNQTGQAQPRMIYCSACAKQFPSNMKFCPNCGYEGKRCPNCGSDNLREARRCVNCGAMLPEQARTCSHCHQELPPGATFCPVCGHPVVTDSDKCSRCGSVIPPTAKFCPRCGKKR